ncbi:ThiF family adenylyltransferase [Heliobacterium undosum]|uniref:ThiF family adenylyltransferase n=1 Tax=Heliomicrobium undosum TaxID=121734 RepID=A0A845L0L7_9FIRM|nr:ThiF family adenylyltransferase [Heliomicrobium undosum]MZP29997.1 ThiF family adenylyltransferase [Heliomicrobium undosum]
MNLPWNDLFSRNIGVITPEQQHRLRKSRVAMAGLGAIGGNVLHMLVRAGVEKFSLAEFDTFSVSNCNRQFGASPSTVGRPKIDVLAQMAREINPQVDIQTYPEGLTEENLDRFLDGADAVVDAIDFLNPQIRKSLIVAARAQGLYVFLAPALGFGASLVVFSPTGPTYDEFFGPLPASLSPEDLLKLGRKLFPRIPEYVDLAAYLKGMGAGGYLPTFAPPILLASTLAATNLIFLLTGVKQPRCAPQVTWIDLMEEVLQVIDLDKEKR